MKTLINDEYLGAETELSPEVIAFLNPPLSISETHVKQNYSGQRNDMTLDEYEQAMVA